MKDLRYGVVLIAIKNLIPIKILRSIKMSIVKNKCSCYKESDENYEYNDFQTNKKSLYCFRRLAILIQIYM